MSDRYRSVDPDVDIESEEHARLERIIGKLVERGGYSEGRDKWIMPLLVTLLTSFILGGIALTVTVAALKQEVADQTARTERIEKIIEPRYRGSP